jgi:phosphoketolase
MDIPTSFWRRYDLAIEALRRAGRGDRTAPFEAKLRAHRADITEHDEGMPEVQGWRWSDTAVASTAS